MGQIKKAVLNGQAGCVELSDRAFGSGPLAVDAGRPGAEVLELLANVRCFGALSQRFAALNKKLRLAKVGVECRLPRGGDAKFYGVNAAGEAGVKVTAGWAPQA